jgi:predicted alpha/beta hydrolase family esterase
MEVLKVLGYQTYVESHFQVKWLEHDARTEMLQVQNKNWELKVITQM